MNIIAKFELWCFVSTVVLKIRFFAKPQNVSGNFKDDRYQKKNNRNSYYPADVMFKKCGLRH